MTRLRPLVVLVLAAVLVTTGCAAFEPSPGGSVSPSGPGSSATSAAGPVTVAIADFDRSTAESIVRVVGLVSLPASVRKVEQHYPVRLEDRADPGLHVTAWIRVSDATPPAPNTMADLPSNYSSSDLLLTTEDGSAIHDGDTVALTGIVKKPESGSAYLDYVTRIEVAEGTAATGTPEPGATATAAPGPTATTAPRDVTIADLGNAAEGETVRVVGLIRVPGSTRTAGGYCSIDLQDSTKPSRRVTVSIRVGTETSPPPNTMAPLGGFFYNAADLLLTAEDGTAVHDGDGVALTGTVAKTGDVASLAEVTRIEVAKAPLPKAVAVTFTTIKKQKAGTFVRITGRLDVPFLTSCSTTCGIYLEDRATGASVRIEVVRGVKGKRVPNTMWPLPSNYRLSDLRVVANDGRVLKGGARVRVTGWIVVGSDKKRRIDPVIRIDYAP